MQKPDRDKNLGLRKVTKMNKSKQWKEFVQEEPVKYGVIDKEIHC